MVRGCHNLPNDVKLRMPVGCRTSETVGPNVHRREGNNPDMPLRSPSTAEWERLSGRSNNQEVGLEAATL